MDAEATPAGPPLKIISPAERAAKLKELSEKGKAMQDALKNQKHLMGKLEAAKTPKEKAAIMKLLQLTMTNIKSLKESVEKTQNEITPVLRTTKINNKVGSGTGGGSVAAGQTGKDETSPAGAIKRRPSEDAADLSIDEVRVYWNRK